MARSSNVTVPELVNRAQTSTERTPPTRNRMERAQRDVVMEWVEGDVGAETCAGKRGGLHRSATAITSRQSRTDCDRHGGTYR
jgi:hypothetical protein